MKEIYLWYLILNKITIKYIKDNLIEGYILISKWYYYLYLSIPNYSTLLIIKNKISIRIEK